MGTDIPETGEYAVYVSYQTLPGSVSDAKYLVFHNGGVTEFKVNQQIGGGTWVYLGTFAFDKGRNDYGMVVLSNESKEKGVVCRRCRPLWRSMGNNCPRRTNQRLAQIPGRRTLLCPMGRHALSRLWRL